MSAAAAAPRAKLSRVAQTGKDELPRDAEVSRFERQSIDRLVQRENDNRPAAAGAFTEAEAALVLQSDLVYQEAISAIHRRHDTIAVARKRAVGASEAKATSRKRKRNSNRAARADGSEKTHERTKRHASDELNAQVFVNTQHFPLKSTPGEAAAAVEAAKLAVDQAADVVEQAKVIVEAKQALADLKLKKAQAKAAAAANVGLSL